MLGVALRIGRRRRALFTETAKELGMSRGRVQLIEQHALRSLERCLAYTLGVPD